MQSNYETQAQTLRGPRPMNQQRSTSSWSKFPRRQPRLPINVIVPTKKFVPPTSPTENYVYPPPKPKMNRKESKTELFMDEIGIFPILESSSSTNTIEEEEEDLMSYTQTKKLPPKPKPSIIKKPTTCYSTDEENEDSDLEEEILREFKLSRKKSVHDITISDDEEEEEEDFPMKTNYHVNSSMNKNRSNQEPPAIPSISAPGYSSSEEEETPPIPVICVPEEDDDTPPIPTICVPEDEDVTQKSQKQKKASILNSLFFGVRCGGCDEPLSGQTISTSGTQWHPRCFKCQTCKQNLEHIAFYEMNGLPYCALDYHELFSPRCDFCKTPIEEHSISALGKTYHAGHFFCRECGKPFDENSNFLEHEGHAYCEKDYYKQFGKACKGCEETITGDFLVALGGEWHKECFVCADCGGAFNSSTFLIKGGKPYCEEHYDKQKSYGSQKNNISPTLLKDKRKKLPSISVPRTKLDLLPDIFPELNSEISKARTSEEEEKVCHKCEKPIQGRFLSAFGYDYHPLHFQCSHCSKLLSARITGLYQKGVNNEIVCKPCARKSNPIK